MGQVQTNGRPIQLSDNVADGVPAWGAKWKKFIRDHYQSTVVPGTGVHGSFNSYRDIYLDLDPTYKDRLGRPLVRITMDFHENELKMNAYLTDKFAEIIKQMGAREVLKKPRKGPYDITEYQTTHLCGGAIMGTDPKTSAMNRYCQSWDLPNLFVTGASNFRRTQATIQPARWARWLSGPRKRSAKITSKIRGRLSMRKGIKLSAAACVALTCMAYAQRGRAVDQQDFSLVQKGEYLTIAADCSACHTVPGRGKPFAGGRPIETPFGNVVSANITPDRETGIGGWTGEEFRTALKSGIGKGGIHLYPAMPYVYYSKLKDEDVAAIWAYLSTVEPVRNEVVTNQLPFPYNIRPILWFWNLLYRPQPGWSPEPGKSADCLPASPILNETTTPLILSFSRKGRRYAIDLLPLPWRERAGVRGCGGPTRLRAAACGRSPWAAPDRSASRYSPAPLS